MQYQVTNRYQTGENRVCPKAARACPNPRRLNILRTNLFLDLKLSGMVPLIIFYYCWSFQQNLMIFSRDMGQKPHFGPILGPNLGQDFFFRISGFVTLNRQGWKFEFFNPRNSWAKRGGTQAQWGVTTKQREGGKQLGVLGEVFWDFSPSGCPKIAIPGGNLIRILINQNISGFLNPRKSQKIFWNPRNSWDPRNSFIPV